MSKIVKSSATSVSDEVAGGTFSSSTSELGPHYRQSKVIEIEKALNCEASFSACFKTPEAELDEDDVQKRHRIIVGKFNDSRVAPPTAKPQTLFFNHGFADLLCTTNKENEEN